MAKKSTSTESEPVRALFELDDFNSAKPPTPASIVGKIWTRNKAQLIARYLYSFLSVTKNGIYIDAFAGPQKVEDREESWAALRFLEKESKFLNRAYLFEQDPSKIQYLDNLRSKYCQGFTRLWKRQVLVFPGDCNQEIPKCLKKHPIKANKAAFALLDQRTHECTWDLVKTLATHKTQGTKIELFYFLAQGWMNRSIKSSTTTEKLQQIDAWWGGNDWQAFVEMNSYARSQFMENRFMNELGYKFARAFPMYEKGHDGKIMFWLIHASDHPRAIPLMISAYKSIGLHWSDERWEQGDIEDLINELGDNPTFEFDDSSED